MTSNMTQNYVIPQLGKGYSREEYPVGARIVLRLCSAIVASNNHITVMKSEGTIVRYVSFNDEDNAYDQVEIQWEASSKNKTTILMLQNILLIEDKEKYLQQDKEHRAIKFAMLEVGGAFHTSFNTWEEWAELDLDTYRKIALIKAGIPIANIATYANLSAEEILSLKNYLRELEKEDK